MRKTRQIRYFIFLRDVLAIAVTGFGGPNVHLTMFIKRFVIRHGYLTEAELMELQALCQILPGPTSTQTLTAIGFKLGGPLLAYLTLLVWIFPATVVMAVAALAVTYIDSEYLLKITFFIKPMGIAFIFYAAYVIGRKVIQTKTSWVLMVAGAGLAFLYRSPYITPLVILMGGVIAAFKYDKQEKLEKHPLHVDWGNFLLWAGVFGAAIAIGSITQNLPVRLFENFYRNGSLAFGGGHIMKPLLFNEFVEFKNYLTADEFLSGIAISELVPGPTFSIASFVGSLSMREWGVSGQFLGAAIAAFGIFLPGILMIFFVVRFWNQLKQYRAIRASLEGINASSTGLTIAAGISLFEPMADNMISVWTAFVTFIILITTKVPSYALILGGLLLGVLLNL
ncbi:chromate efflux transporter [Jiulongibacter sediminis]|uniref:Chromate transporter n=1 Tax=Jiulongibacter sediminis TaxID=1605367 RepID=A0A0P7BS05_9BACT|nr:chromate efflux transporter [Jiulongibacter sediminis]KPM47750.1 chromate transporter [Jiulongibacter sediminis]TBX23933.1 chromate transporter [Jiulongibacter sediminis]